MKEQSMIEKLKRRDESGLEELMIHYSPLMRYIMSPILSDERDIEECLQDAVLRIWQEIDRFDPQKGSWKSWLTTIVRNLALNRARAEKRREAGELDEEEADRGPTPEESILRKEQQDRLLQALNALRQEDRTLFYRKYYYRQSVRQIAAELGTTERCIEGKLYRIRQALKNQLKGEEHGRI